VEGRPPDESLLVSRAQAGDAGAFGALVAAHQQLAFRVAFLIVGDAAEAEDAVQEAFVKAYHALERFRPAEPFRPWLLRIAANTARNRRRTAARQEGLRLRAATHAGDSTEPSAEVSALGSERRRELMAAINELPVDDRVVIGARYFLDLTEAEIAEVAGIARGTVKSRLFRARARLQQRLLDSGWELTDDA
jgi:RNA polymerase sigma factor (sigma-70 family)